MPASFFSGHVSRARLLPKRAIGARLVRGRERHVACRALTKHRRPARPFCPSESPCAVCQSTARMPRPRHLAALALAALGARSRYWRMVPSSGPGGARVHSHSCHGTTHSRLSVAFATERVHSLPSPRRIARMASLALVQCTPRQPERQPQWRAKRRPERPSERRPERRARRCARKVAPTRAVSSRESCREDSRGALPPTFRLAAGSAAGLGPARRRLGRCSWRRHPRQRLPRGESLKQPRCVRVR